MKGVASEFLQLIKEHKMLVAVIAVITVPILYAGLFLWAFWDPYDHLESIPVAVVNDDAGYDYEGEHLELGDELVENLKDEEDGFDFHFVDKETAVKGLEDQDYYITIQIPENFSEYSTTVMDDNPKKMELIYTPNEGYNFLAGQIGETAMLKVEQALEEKVTETYTETIFETIEEVADGLVDASDATEELHDGTGELKDGSTELKDNLITLAEKTLEFKNGLNTAADGSDALTDGAGKLADGVNELHANSVKLYQASNELSAGADQLEKGITAAKDGLGEMDKNMPALMDGTGQVQAGLGQLHKQLPQQMAQELDKQIKEASGTILTGTNELRTGIISGLEDSLEPQLIQGLSEGLSTQLSQGVASEMKQMVNGVPDQASNAIAKEVTGQIRAEQEKQTAQLTDALKQAGIPDETIHTIANQMDTPDYEAMENQIAGQLQGALSSISMTDAQQNELAQKLENQINAGIEQTIQGAIGATVDNVNNGFDEFETGIQAGLGDATNGLEGQIAGALDQPIGQLQGGLSEIQQGQKAVSGGISQLSQGASALEDGSKTLAAGEKEYAANMKTYSEAMNDAQNGVNELFTGAVQLKDGIYKLKDGSYQLNDGSNKLADGSVELDDGVTTLFDATGEFNDKMMEAADEAGDVENKDATNQMMANPVEVKNEKVNAVPNYGTGFAPYFLSLGLFVGALLLSIVFPLREPAGRPTSGFNWFFSKLAVMVSVGILQALIASGFLLIVLGLEVKSVPLFILFAVITSLAFITLIQFLVTCFADPGRFIAIIILILQLTTSAGTFPLEVIPKALQPFNMLLPMTYSVQGFKAVISNGAYNVMWQNAGVLAGFTIVFMALTLSYFIVMHKRKFGKTIEDAA